MKKAHKKGDTALRILFIIGLSVTVLLVGCLIFSYTSALDTFLMERAVGTYKFDSIIAEEDGVSTTLKKGDKYLYGLVELTEDYAVLTLNKDGTFEYNESLFGGTDGTYLTGTWTRKQERITLASTGGEKKTYITKKNRIILEKDDGIELVLLKQGI